MGWYEDNHDSGGEDERVVMERLGLGNTWHKDPQPGASGSSRQTARVERPEAEWDSTKWRRSNYKEGDTLPKTKAKSQFLLTEKDLLPLEYHKGLNSRGFAGMKSYLKRDCELASWVKHGGPNGLKAAKLEKKNKPPSPRKPKGMSLNTAAGDAMPPNIQASTSVAAFGRPF
ncbi:hypothetical protein PLICRDRAFT_53431 [Plicaturopsis crispa FD-325 SS-3]|nr:hypothetical protein PLICRDRAFT_53431 [Plicaturopsis crispa FD-325 SS-3]